MPVLLVDLVLLVMRWSAYLSSWSLNRLPTEMLNVPRPLVSACEIEGLGSSAIRAFGGCLGIERR